MLVVIAIAIAIATSIFTMHFLARQALNQAPATNNSNDSSDDPVGHP